MNLVLLMLVLFMIFTASCEAYNCAQKYQVAPLLSALTIACFLILVGSLLPGACGLYQPLAVAITTMVLCGTTELLLRRFAKTKLEIPQITVPLTVCKRGPWTPLIITISVLAALFCYPYFFCFATLMSMLVSPNTELGWDAVSYHLPAIVEYIQNHSLWSFQGPYQSYSYGFELIYGLSMLFCHSHWSVIIGHIISVILLLASVIFIVGQLLDVLESRGIRNINRVMVHLLSQACWVGGIFSTSLAGVGNNDVFEAATLLSTFGFLLTPWTRAISDGAKKYALILGSMSFCLALSTKPPALMFAPLFICMAFAIPATIRPKTRAQERSQARAEAQALAQAKALEKAKALGTPQTQAKDKPVGNSSNQLAIFSKYGIQFDPGRVGFALPLFMVSIVVGTFFLWHNISYFGGVTDPALAIGFRDTLLHHLRDPRLFKPSSSSMMFFASITCIPLILRLWKICGGTKKPDQSAGCLWLIGLFLSGMAAFSYTPFGVTPDYDHNDLTRLFFQDRKAMVMYMAVSIGLSLFLGIVVAQKVKRSKLGPVAPSNLPIPMVVTTVTLVLSLAAVPVLNWWWQRQWQSGLTGYEVVKGLPPTKIYHWAQTLDGKQRIYSSGLRPYGLFGRNYENTLFYDLHSHILKVEKEPRLLSVLNQFHPDIVLISVDPHAYTGGPVKPELIDWMKQQPCFTQIYEDATVTGFRVSPDWRKLLEIYKLPEVPVRMHS